jgi:hypothetical protein
VLVAWVPAALACSPAEGSGSSATAADDDGGGTTGGEDSSGGDAATTRPDAPETTSADAESSEATSAADATTGFTGCDRAPVGIEGIHNDGEFNYAESLPIRIGFDDDAYATDQSIVWASADAGAAHEWIPDGGWDGCGAARFWPPASSENMSGIGQVLGLRNVGDSPFLAIRYCISAGATFPELSEGAKPIILWRADPATQEQLHDDAVGARPMVISRADPRGRGITYGLCDGTVCTYAGGDFWPDGSDTWVLDASGWSCIEFDFDLAADEMQLFVTTQDGRFDDTPYLSATFRDENSGPGGVFTAIDIIGGYFAQAVSDPDNYYTIDDLVIDHAHIGPPPGFAR